jgi:hypothetical protein
MTNRNPCTTPVDTKPKVSSSIGKPIGNATEFRSLAGALQYLTITWLDISCRSTNVFVHAWSKGLRLPVVYPSNIMCTTLESVSVKNIMFVLPRLRLPVVYPSCVSQKKFTSAASGPINPTIPYHKFATVQPAYEMYPPLLLRRWLISSADSPFPPWAWSSCARVSSMCGLVSCDLHAKNTQPCINLDRSATMPRYEPVCRWQMTHFTIWHTPPCLRALSAVWVLTSSLQLQGATCHPRYWASSRRRFQLG